MNPATYSVFIAWSGADEAYVAKVLELPGCMAHGETRAEAIAQSEIAIENWLDTAQELGRPIPEPKHLDSYEKEADAKFEQSAEEFQATWKKAVLESAPTIAENVAKYFAQTSRYVSVVRDERGGIRILFEEPWYSRLLTPWPHSAEEHKSETR
jgi:predicted RNase H-like HicB family nuclease